MSFTRPTLSRCVTYVYHTGQTVTAHRRGRTSVAKDVNIVAVWCQLGLALNIVSMNDALLPWTARFLPWERASVLIDANHRPGYDTRKICLAGGVTPPPPSPPVKVDLQSPPPERYWIGLVVVVGSCDVKL